MESYVSVVPRLLPSQYSSKRIPINEEGYEYPDPSRSLSSNLSPQGNGNVVGPLSTRTQLNSKNFVQQQNDFPQNNFKGKTNSSRFHHEPLKDNSFNEQYERNSFDAYSNEQLRRNNQQNTNSFNKSTKILIFVFGLIICLFSLTALSISIYLLIRITNSNSLSG